MFLVSTRRRSTCAQVAGAQRLTVGRSQASSYAVDFAIALVNQVNVNVLGEITLVAIDTGVFSVQISRMSKGP